MPARRRPARFLAWTRVFGLVSARLAAQGTAHCHDNRRTPIRRGARVVDRGGLENRCTLAGTEGSNPSLSATPPAVPDRRSTASERPPENQGMALDPIVRAANPDDIIAPVGRPKQVLDSIL